MTGPEHYTTAEQHAQSAEEAHNSSRPEAADYHLRLAGVHATLAVAAATARNDAEHGMPSDDERAWREVAGPVRRKPTS